MRVVTWNVNSIRQRLPRLIALLERWEPDVLCVQETKVADRDFPIEPLQRAGYAALSHGQGGRNGVAIASRLPLEEIGRGLPGSPVPDDARLLVARAGDLTIASVYAVNGKEVGDPAYEAKLAWFDALRAWASSAIDPAGPVLLAGDFNVTPDDRDVHDPDLWRGRNLASEPERDRLRALIDVGLVDLGRRAAGDVTGPFTFWDYRMGAFHRGWGLRLDLALATTPVAERLISVEVDREERKPTAGEGKPSDHAPLIVTLSD
ncbi:MAG TPA: exodeoxyribonuclease III [Actinomycetota bacterium]|nr:exodeoxyribonuclease III [Actinomycetota bacterium]